MIKFKCLFKCLHCHYELDINSIIPYKNGTNYYTVTLNSKTGRLNYKLDRFESQHESYTYICKYCGELILLPNNMMSKLLKIN